MATQRSQPSLAFSHTSFIEAQEAKAHSLPSLQAWCLVQNCSMVILLRLIYGSYTGNPLRSHSTTSINVELGRSHDLQTWLAEMPGMQVE
jgi:hypothetical protein